MAVAAIPFIIAIAGAVAAAVGGVVAANNEVGAAKNQQKLLEAQAKSSISVADRQEEAQRRKADQVMGAQRAALAENGLGFSGSSLDIMEQSATNAELDALNIRYRGASEAWSLRAEGDQLVANARQKRKLAVFSAITGIPIAGGTAAANMRPTQGLTNIVPSSYPSSAPVTGTWAGPAAALGPTGLY